MAQVSTPFSFSVIASLLDFGSHARMVIRGSSTPGYATSQAHPQFNSSSQGTIKTINSCIFCKQYEGTEQLNSSLRAMDSVVEVGLVTSGYCTISGKYSQPRW